MSDLPQTMSYFNPLLKVSILIPDGWEVQQLSGDRFQIIGPTEAKFDGYRSRISYTRTIPEDDSEQWFEDTIRKSEAKQRQVYQDYQIIKEERLWLGQHRAYLRQAQWCYEGTDIYLVNLQGLIWAEATAAYIIKAETLKEFETTYITIFEAIARSTRIVEANDESQRSP